jgi:hypothetical protein
MYEKHFLIKIQTYFRLLKTHSSEILFDLGFKSIFKIMEENGYVVKNTKGKI